MVGTSSLVAVFETTFTSLYHTIVRQPIFLLAIHLLTVRVIGVPLANDVFKLLAGRFILGIEDGKIINLSEVLLVDLVSPRKQGHGSDTRILEAIRGR